MSDSRNESEINLLKLPNGLPEFNARDVLQWKLLFSGFLRRFDGSHIVITTDEPSPVSDEKVRKSQKQIPTPQGISWKNTDSTKILLEKNSAERAL